MTNQGVYGIAIGVMAQYFVLFILFGVLAMCIGLGQLFIDLAMVVAGRYSGGPAKVAIFSSAFMVTISGSSISNTVTTGALTIPAMKRVGYPVRILPVPLSNLINKWTDHSTNSWGCAACVQKSFLKLEWY